MQKIGYCCFKNMLKLILGSEDEWYKQRNRIKIEGRIIIIHVFSFTPPSLGTKYGF